MHRSELSRIAHTHHPLAAPVSPATARTLLHRLGPQADGRVLDLGCGFGEWLLTLLANNPAQTGVGVDIARPALDEARRAADRRGVADRVRWAEADASSWAEDPVDAVLCVGASHAFGGLDATLTAIRRYLRPGGVALLGDSIWEAPPTPAAQTALDAGPQDFPDLAGLVARVGDHGFEPGYGHVSTLQEWDDYEWSWTGSVVEWALHEATSPGDREEALAAAREHRRGWLEGYRGQLGFVTVVLHDVHAA